MLGIVEEIKKRILILIPVSLLIAVLLFLIADIWGVSHEVGHYSMVVTNDVDGTMEVISLQSGDETIDLHALSLFGDWYATENNTLVTKERGAGFSLEFDGLGDFTLMLATGPEAGDVKIIQSTGIEEVLQLQSSEIGTCAYNFSNDKVFHKKLFVFYTLVILVVAVIITISGMVLILPHNKKSYGQLAVLVVATLLWMLCLRDSLNAITIQYTFINFVTFNMLALAGVWCLGVCADKVSEHLAVDVNKTRDTFVHLVLHTIGPVLIFLYVEGLLQYYGYRHGIGIFVANIIFYYAIDLIVFFLFANTRLSLTVSFGVAALCAYTDYFVWLLRNRNFMASDISVATTALKVSGQYDFYLDVRRLIFLVIAIVFVIMTAMIPRNTKQSIRIRVIGILGAVAIAIGMYEIVDRVDLADKYNYVISWWNDSIRGQYAEKGFALSFVTYGQQLKMEVPDDYSVSSVEAILDNIQGEIDERACNDSYSTSRPNVIVIMNEAWSDLFSCKDGMIDKDCMPFFHSLSDNTIKGQMYVSVEGGNTVDTEYEFLTGNTMAFFPTGSVPYMQYISDVTESAERYYECSGYNHNTLHPYYAFSYNRDSVYDKMGFTNCTWIDGIAAEDQESFGSWFSERRTFELDEEIFEKNQSVNTENETDNPLFLFNVTIQNHGGYGQDYQDSRITIDYQLGDLLAGDIESTEYVCKLSETDKALEQLINYFTTVDDDTVIVMFGDHQPKLPQATYDIILPQDGSIEALQTRYTTPFFIWANFDIDEAQDVKMSANYLNAYIIDMIGMEPSAYYQYLIDQYRLIPAMNAFGYLGDDGNWYEYGKGPQIYEDAIKQYRQIQYYNVTEDSKKVEYFR